jgi:TldD protein
MLLDKSIIESTISYALEKGADFAEVFVEKNFSQNLNFLSGKTEAISSNIDFGLGLRLFFGEEILYATSNILTEAALRELVDKLCYKSVSQQKNAASSFPNSPLSSTGLTSLQIKPWDQSIKDKVAFLSALDKTAREQSSLIQQVSASLKQNVQEVLIANSEGIFVEDIRPYTTCIIQCIAEESGQKQQGMERIGQMMGSEFLDSFSHEAFAKKAANQAVRLLSAKDAPAGKMPVILNNGFGGVIFHEACGHGLETTSVATGASVFSGKLDQKIAHEEVTAIDNGQMQHMWGSLEFDDEGEKTQNTTLIENGVLKSYLVDKMGAIKTGYKTTGSGRRQSYHFAPASRMRNTYIAPGKHSLEDMIKDVDYGLFAEHLGGGSVDTGTGAYNFAVREARVIRNGRLEEKVKGASLIGTGFDTLSKITKVGKDLELAPGTCGSVSGWVPVTVGQPPLLVSEITVGGAGNE